MADTKISALPASTTPLAGTEVLPIVQSGTTKKTSIESVLTSVQPSGTANGVAYLNGSKVLTTGSALTFDGTLLQNSSSIISGRSGGADGSFVLKRASDNLTVGTLSVDSTNSLLNLNTAYSFLTFSTEGSEKMRLNNTGLGIGTSSIVYGASGRGVINLGGSGGGLLGFQVGGVAKGYVAHFDSSMQMWNEAASPILFATNALERMRLDSSGNLGLGVTPSTGGYGRAFQVVHAGNGGALTAQAINTNNYPVNLTANAISSGASTWKYFNTDGGSATRYQQVGGTHAWFTAPSGTAGDAISFTQAMTLDADGDLGIGETSPAVKLHTKFSSNTAYSATAQSPNAVWFVNDSTTTNAYTGIGLTVGASGSATVLLNAIRTADFETAFAITTRGSGGTYAERARITSSGQFLINTTSPLFGDERLAVNGISGGIGQAIYANGTSSIGLLLYSSVATGATAGKQISFVRNDGVEVGSITSNGSATLYNTTSDQRLKENIQDAAPASALIDSLQVRQYDWKADGNHQRYGFIAQELLAVAPEAVHQPADPEEMMAVDYSKLVPMLVKEIQSLRQRLAAAGI
jgi:hypothetical protein